MLKALATARVISHPFRDSFLSASTQPKSLFGILPVRSRAYLTIKAPRYALHRAQLQPAITRRISIPQRCHRVRCSSTNRPPPEPAQAQVLEQKSQSVSERFKELSRKYGWAAVGVYFGLSALDFPFCFLAVRLLGPERIGQAEHWVVDGFWSVAETVVPGVLGNREVATAEGGAAAEVEATIKHHKEHETATIWTQLLLAYGVHKSLIFFRVPLAAAVTPRVVRWLRARGWKIGNPKA